MSRRQKTIFKKGYDVGYGKPPQETRFKKGASGNPMGRPKGAKNRVVVMQKKLNDIILAEAYRDVEMNDKAGLVTIPVVQAVIRSVAIKAVKGQM